jgi:hypothetical protein
MRLALLDQFDSVIRLLLNDPISILARSPQLRRESSRPSDYLRISLRDFLILGQTSVIRPGRNYAVAVSPQIPTPREREAARH